MLEVDSALLGDGQQPRDVALRAAQPRGVLELAGGVLEAQAELLVARLLEALHELVVLEVVHLGGLHSLRPLAPRRSWS